jgi:hypothetical protein
MKKLLFLFLLFTTLSCGIGGGGLDPINSNQCEKALEEYEKGLPVWLADPENKSNCEAFKKSLTKVIKECSVYTAAQRKAYEDQLKQLTCE